MAQSTVARTVEGDAPVSHSRSGAGAAGLDRHGSPADGSFGSASRKGRDGASQAGPGAAGADRLPGALPGPAEATHRAGPAGADRLHRLGRSQTHSGARAPEVVRARSEPGHSARHLSARPRWYGAGERATVGRPPRIRPVRGRQPGRGGKEARHVLVGFARIEIGGTPSSSPAAYALRSPMHYVRRLATNGVPLDIWWSRNDRIVTDQNQESGRLYRAIKQVNPKAAVEQFVGTWAHSHEMHPLARLPLALVDLNIVELDEPLSKAVKP